MAENRLKNIPVGTIRIREAKLRGVERESEGFLELVQSVRQHGVMKSILVREEKDKDTGSTFYELIDGLQRVTAAQEAGVDTVPANIVSADDKEALEKQMVLNLHVIETKAAAYSDGLKRLLAFNEKLTIPELARTLGKSVTWLTERLKISKLPDSVKEAIDEGKINVTNAQALAMLPPDEVADYVDKASSMTPQQFSPLVKQRAKELRDAARQGREPRPNEFTPTPFLRGLPAVRDELDSLQIGKSLIHQEGAQNPLDGWILALRWVTRMDPDSVKQQRAEHEERQRLKEEKKAALKAEKLNKKMEQGAELAVTV